MLDKNPDVKIARVTRKSDNLRYTSYGDKFVLDEMIVHVEMNVGDPLIVLGLIEETLTLYYVITPNGLTWISSDRFKFFDWENHD